MQLHTKLSSFLAVLSSASYVLADAINDIQPTSTIDAAAQMVTPDAALRDYLEHGNDLDNHLELRQATEYNLAATTAPTQAPAVTTFYMNQKIGTTVTWAPIVYTQAFADVPDQLPSPGVGSIGLGNLVKQEKREAAPTPAVPAPATLPTAEPLVLELHEVGVTQWIQPVTQFTELVVSTVLPTSAIDNASNATITDMNFAKTTASGALAEVASARVLP